MNTLSSLLNWIGATIGANPSTLKTSSKTIVGAINEAVGAKPSTLVTTSKNLVGAVNEAVGANPNTLATTSKNLVGATNELKAFNDINEITVTAASTTTGTLVDSSCYCRRCGNIVWVSLQVRNANSTIAGGNIYEGVLSSSLPRPYAITMSGGYFGIHAMTGSITPDRKFIVRNASSSAVTIASPYTVTVSFTYITQD